MREHGFGLLEVVLTVGILGTLAALAVPFFARWGSLWQLEYEAARLASEVRYYREVTGTFQPQHRDFLSVPKESTPIFGFERREYYLRRGTRISRRHMLADGIVLSASRPQLTFSSKRTRFPFVCSAGRPSDMSLLTLPDGCGCRVSPQSEAEHEKTGSRIFSLGDANFGNDRHGPRPRLLFLSFFESAALVLRGGCHGLVLGAKADCADRGSPGGVVAKCR